MKRFEKLKQCLCAVALAFACFANLQAQQPLPPNTNSPSGGTNTVDWAAIEAAQQAQVAQEFGPWLLPDASLQYANQGYTSQSINSGGPAVFTAAEKESIRISTLQALSASNQTRLHAEQTGIQAFLATNNVPKSLQSSNGSDAVLRRIENGNPVYFALHDLGQAKTMAVPALWTNGVTGLNLNGENMLIGEFDGGNALTNHQELGARVSNFDPTLAVAGHSTCVAGVLASSGLNTNAIGMSPRSSIRAYQYGVDTAQMPLLAGTNHAQLSNHSYGRVAGWYGYVSGAVYTSNFAYVGYASYFPVWYGDVTVSKKTDFIFGSYNADAVNVDTIIYNANSYLPVFSSGNESGINALPNLATNGASSGFYSPSYNGPYGHWVLPGDANFPTPPANGTNDYTTITSHACAKNNLVQQLFNIVIYCCAQYDA
jgi:hypothetical protein